jgi:hypothetical protein
MVYVHGPDDSELLFLSLWHYHLQLKSGCQLSSNVRLKILYFSMIVLLAYGHYCISIKIHHSATSVDLCASDYSNILCFQLCSCDQNFVRNVQIVSVHKRSVYSSPAQTFPPWLVLLFLQINMELRHSGKNVRQFSNFWTVTQGHYFKLEGAIPSSAQGHCCGLDTLVNTGAMLWAGYLGQHRDIAVGWIPKSAQGHCCGLNTFVSTGTVLWAGYLGQHRDNAMGWIPWSAQGHCCGLDT